MLRGKKPERFCPKCCRYHPYIYDKANDEWNMTPECAYCGFSIAYTPLAQRIISESIDDFINKLLQEDWSESAIQIKTTSLP